ncbi:TetR/AcrR family transcriptional regulator [Psychromarinibacter sp. S121]|uniref:TetR/AcrR family transcriptional regulator n=1 Tax=Psychromarinibacter sp. S121 TaxID=3415127 RepID=UPI003C7DE094
MTDTPSGPGRPVDQKVSRRLKETALNLVREHGYRDVSISSIVATAKVSRQSLYNRWNSKADLVLDALAEDALAEVAHPITDDGSTAHAALVTFLTQVFAHLARDGRTLQSLIAAAQDDPEFGSQFHAAFVAPREEIVTALLYRAQASGELAPHRDVPILSAFVHGAFWYRLLNGQPLDADLASRIADEVFR